MGVSIFSDGVHCLSESAGFLDSEDIDGDQVGRGSDRWGSESLGEGRTFVVGRKLS